MAWSKHISAVVSVTNQSTFAPTIHSPLAGDVVHLATHIWKDAANVHITAAVDNQASPLTYTRVVDLHLNNTDSNGVGVLDVFYGVPSAPGGTYTVTFTLSATGVDITLNYAIFTGGAATPYDSAVLATAAGTGTTLSVTSGTPSEAGELFIAAHADAGGGQTFTKDAAWTQLDQSSNVNPQFTQYIINTGTSSDVAGCTSSSSETWASAVVGFKVSSVTPACVLSDTATASITEADIVTGGKIIVATLTDDTFVAAATTTTTADTFPTSGTSEDRSAATAWTNPDYITADDTSYTTAVVPTDYLIATHFNFAIPANATILGVTVKVNASETGTGTSDYVPQLVSDATPTLIGDAKGAVAVSGSTKVTSTNGGTSDVWGASLTPTIVNADGFGVAIWSADTVNTLSVDFITIAITYSVPTFDDARQAFINGFDGNVAGGTGWDAEVKAKAAVTEVVRTSSTVVTWTIAAQAGYNIASTETITGTIPASILTSGAPITATPTIAITATGGAATAVPVFLHHYKLLR